MSKATMRESIIETLAREAGCFPDQITGGMLLQGSLGIGVQVGRVEFLTLKEDLEKRLGVQIPADRVPEDHMLPLMTVDELIELFTSAAEVAGLLA